MSDTVSDRFVSLLCHGLLHRYGPCNPEDLQLRMKRAIATLGAEVRIP